MNSSSKSLPGCAGFNFFIISVIICNFNFVRVSVHPPEADSPLPVDANAMLPLPVALESFQAVSGRNSQVFEANRRIHKLQFVQRLLLDVPWRFPGALTLPDFLGFPALKTNDQ